MHLCRKSSFSMYSVAEMLVDIERHFNYSFSSVTIITTIVMVLIDFANVYQTHQPGSLTYFLCSFKKVSNFLKFSIPLQLNLSFYSIFKFFCFVQCIVQSILACCLCFLNEKLSCASGNISHETHISDATHLFLVLILLSHSPNLIFINFSRVLICSYIYYKKIE